MRYLSVCSGIEAASVAWHPLGWQAAAYSEIEAFPRAVLKHHYPDVPLHGDFTTIGADDYGTVDLIVGGTPCQAFSVAGLRKGFADMRGNLTLEFLRLADRKRPRWLVWENVPGVLSIDGGRAFGAFLGGLAELGYGFADRILDAQYFGVAQRRRRVFVIGYSGDWRRAAAVLFERESLQGDSPPRREAGKGVARKSQERIVGCLAANMEQGNQFALSGQFVETVAPTISARTKGGGGLGTDFDCDGGLICADVAPTVDASFGDKWGLDNQHIDSGAGMFVTHTLRGNGHDASEDGTGRGTPIVCFPYNMSTPSSNDQNVASTLQAENARAVAVGSAVRRLTPRECERLQGFLDDYTLVPYRGKVAADGPRYKALGNSMAVPVMRWIGERIQMVENLTAKSEVQP